MRPLKTLFVCEFITGGGLAGEDLPEGLAREGALMRDALLRELAELSDWHVVTTLDARLDAVIEGVTYVSVDQAQDVWAVWQRNMTDADAVWVIAPETHHILHRLAAMAEACQTLWLGAGLNAIAVTSDKHQTAQVLSAGGISAISTYFYDEWTPRDAVAWLVKPNDGAGCEATFLLGGAQAVIDWFAENEAYKRTHIIQPYMAGIPASISVLGSKGQALLLSCNLQKIELTEGQLHYRGGIINGANEYRPALATLSQKMNAIIPDLEGYYGVDVLLNPAQPEEITVIEINPRLTTSYVHLPQAIGYNVARMVVDAKLGNVVAWGVETNKNPIEFNLEHAI